MEDVKFHRKPCDDYERNTRERRMKVFEIERGREIERGGWEEKEMKVESAE